MPLMLTQNLRLVYSLKKNGQINAAFLHQLREQEKGPRPFQLITYLTAL